ncbi:MAG: hypothetical protein ACFE7E_05975 [Candidatus Hodarchaeota archaeon]
MVPRKPIDLQKVETFWETPQLDKMRVSQKELSLILVNRIYPKNKITLASHNSGESRDIVLQLVNADPLKLVEMKFEKLEEAMQHAYNILETHRFSPTYADEEWITYVRAKVFDQYEQIDFGDIFALLCDKSLEKGGLKQFHLNSNDPTFLKLE